MELYPLTFHPIIKDKIWGGHKLAGLLGKKGCTGTQCGESWELAAVGEDISVVAQGPLQGKTLQELVEMAPIPLLGQQVYARYGREFPLLIKFLDAAADLSVQVHPDDAMAAAQHDCQGKSEMWYIIQADREASIINGFTEPLQAEEFQAALQQNRLERYLHRITVTAGEVYEIPPGRIHTIGKGILLAEIQQASDVTYRVYDYDRTDARGHKRELHVAQAVQALDYSMVKPGQIALPDPAAAVSHLVQNPHFSTQLLQVNARLARDYADLDSFVIYTCVSGSGQLTAQQQEYPITAGDVFLLPAALTEVSLQTDSQLKVLETWVPVLT